MKESKANIVRKFIEKEDENLIDLKLEKEKGIEPFIDKNLFCPKCKTDTLKIIETAEGESERVFIQIKCLNCGCEFVLLEDLATSCMRGIENSKARIRYEEKRQEYFKQKMNAGY